MSNADSTSSEPPLERYDESVLSLCLTMDATGAILSINAVGAQQLGYGPRDHTLDGGIGMDNARYQYRPCLIRRRVRPSISRWRRGRDPRRDLLQPLRRSARGRGKYRPLLP